MYLGELAPKDFVILILAESKRFPNGSTKFHAVYFRTSAPKNQQSSSFIKSTKGYRSTSNFYFLVRFKLKHEYFQNFEVKHPLAKSSITEGCMNPATNVRRNPQVIFFRSLSSDVKYKTQQ